MSRELDELLKMFAGRPDSFSTRLTAVLRAIEGRLVKLRERMGREEDLRYCEDWNLKKRLEKLEKWQQTHFNNKNDDSFKWRIEKLEAIHSHKPIFDRLEQLEEQTHAHPGPCVGIAHPEPKTCGTCVHPWRKPSYNGSVWGLVCWYRRGIHSVSGEPEFLFDDTPACDRHREVGP